MWEHDIPNFDVVNREKKIFRGAEPLNQKAWEHLKEQGVKKVVKLNTEKESRDAGAEAAGLTVIRCSITKSEQFCGSPKLSTIKSAVVRGPEGSNILYDCAPI